MKKILTSALVLSSSLSSLFAAEPRILVITEKDTFNGLMIAADKTNFLWRETEKSTVSRKQSRSNATVYFVQPPEFTEALELYKSRNYKDAATKFAAVEKAYSKVDEIPGNPSTLAGFYQLECFRRLEDLEALNAKVATFQAGNLLQENHKVQYELYSVFWDTVRGKAWPRLDSIASDDKWRTRKLPGSLRAQIAYCHGLALEGMEKWSDALIAYNNAFVADFSASEEITRKSAENCLRILLNHKDVQLAMKLYPTEDYSDDSNGAALIKEATSLLKLWDKVLGAGEKVPDKYKVFLKFPPKKG